MTAAEIARAADRARHASEYRAAYAALHLAETPEGAVDEIYAAFTAARKKLGFGDKR